MLTKQFLYGRMNIIYKEYNTNYTAKKINVIVSGEKTQSLTVNKQPKRYELVLNN